MARPAESRCAAPLDVRRSGIQAAAEDLRRRLRGRGSGPGDGAYDTARRVWNPAVDPRPAAVAVARGAADVRTAVAWARRHGLPLAVQGTGHGTDVPGDGALLVNTSAMAGVLVDPDRRIARAAIVLTTAVPDAAAPGAGPQRPAPGGQPLLTREILTLAVVVVLGSIMTILDATIVNVALPTLGLDFRTSISVIQWVPTIYLLSFASVIPSSGWAGDRFGARRVWLVSLAVVLARSLACGRSRSV